MGLLVKKLIGGVGLLDILLEARKILILGIVDTWEIVGKLCGRAQPTNSQGTMSKLSLIPVASSPSTTPALPLSNVTTPTSSAFQNRAESSFSTASSVIASEKSYLTATTSSKSTPSPTMKETTVDPSYGLGGAAQAGVGIAVAFGVIAMAILGVTFVLKKKRGAKRPRRVHRANEGNSRHQDEDGNDVENAK